MTQKKIKNEDLLNNKAFLIGCAFVFVLLISGVIMIVMGYSPVECYFALFKGVFGTKDNFANMLGTATPLIFAGLSMMLASQSGTFNIGIEGQIIAGAFASAMTGVAFGNLPKAILVPLCFLSAMLAGGVWGALVAVLKRYLKVSEIIIAIMLNYIMDYLTQYLVTYHFTVEGAVIRTETLPDNARLTNLMFLSRLNTGIFAAILMVAVIWWILNRTTFGYEMRATGMNSFAAETAGVHMGLMPLAAMFISGAVAGMAGAVEVMGVHGYFVANMTSGYGYTGVAIGVMGGGSALGTMVSGLIFGVLSAGATNMSRMTSMPGEFIQMIQALIIVFVSTPGMIRAMFKRRKR